MGDPTSRKGFTARELNIFAESVDAFLARQDKITRAELQPTPETPPTEVVERVIEDSRFQKQLPVLMEVLKARKAERAAAEALAQAEADRAAQAAAEAARIDDIVERGQVRREQREAAQLRATELEAQITVELRQQLKAARQRAQVLDIIELIRKNPSLLN